jgi:hypothetical protein
VALRLEPAPAQRTSASAAAAALTTILRN